MHFKAAMERKRSISVRKQQTLEKIAAKHFDGAGERGICLHPNLAADVQSLMKKYGAASEDAAVESEEVLEQLLEYSRIVQYQLHSCSYFVHGTRMPAFLGQMKIKTSGPQAMVDFLTNQIKSMKCFQRRPIYVTMKKEFLEKANDLLGGKLMRSMIRNAFRRLATEAKWGRFIEKGDTSLRDKVKDVKGYNARMAGLYKKCALFFLLIGILFLVFPAAGIVLLVLACSAGIYLVYRSYKRILIMYS